MRRLLLIISVLLFTAPGWADEIVGNFRYSISSDGKATVRQFIAPEGFDGNVTIPAIITVNEVAYPVADIYREVFKGNQDITSVVISEGLATIGRNAFNGATNLQEIQIPSSVTEIKGGAFDQCKKLQTVTFASTKALCSIDFETQSSNPLYYSKNLKVGDAVQTAITIPGNVSTVKQYAFYGCKSLTSVVMEEGVTTIEAYAFQNCTSLESVAIPASVTSIGADAFKANPSSLVKATFSSVDKLCAITFANIASNPLYAAHHLYFGDSDSEVTKVTLPSVATIKPYTFAGASSITEVTIPQGVTAIGDDAFNGCEKIATVNYSSAEQLMTMQYGSGIANPLFYRATPVAQNAALGTLEFTTDISNNAFTNAKWLTEIVIGSNVKTIGKNAFKSCSNLSKITFKGTPTLQTIGKEAFEDCSSLTEITLPASLTTLDTLALRGTRLKTVAIPAGCTILGTSIFEYCTQLETVTFSTASALTTMPNYIFNNCFNLTVVTLPGGLTTIRDGAFKNCSKLAAPPVTDKLTTIGNNAFDGCKGFVTLMLADAAVSLNELGTGAFQNCSNITTASLPETIDKIGSNAFNNCTSLADLYIRRETVPGTVFANSFGERQSEITLHVETEEAVTAYKNSNSIWASFKAIEAKKETTLNFYLNESLDKTITNEAGKPVNQTEIPTYSGNPYFTGWYNSEHEIVEVPAVMPAEDMNFYGYQAKEKTEGLFTFLLQPAETLNGRNLGPRATVIETHLKQADANVTLPREVADNGFKYTTDSIAPNAFENAEVYKLELPATVKAIGSGAFKGCQNLQSVNIPEALTALSDHLFEGCTGLTSITIPSTVEKIGLQAFNNTGITEITIPESVTTMDNEVFKDCKSLEKATFSEGFSLPIPKYTFWNCTKLADVTLSRSTGVIGLNAFQQCDSLKTIELPEGITIISAYAFADCKTLNRITLPATLSMIGNKAFTGCDTLTQITVKSTEKAPSAAMDAFDVATRQKAALYVTNHEIFKTVDPWKNFQNIATQANFNLVLKVNGEIYKTLSCMAGSAITPLDTPEGYADRVFSGWKGVPDIMPAEETTVEGNFLYDIKFYEDAVDNGKRLLKDNDYKFFFGDKITLPTEALLKAGHKYTLKGLTADDISEDDAAKLDMTMPAKDINVIVTYSLAEVDTVFNSINYRVYMLENRAEVTGCVATATTLTIPDAVTYNGKNYPVTEIKGSAFKNNTKITSVTINNSIKVIGDEAFKGCRSLVTITMPATLDSIGQQAFANTSVTSVTVPYAPKMGKEIFYWCTKLANIGFTASLTALPERIFQGCLSLEEVTIPEQITTIGDFAFANCSTIKNLTLPAAVTKLGSYAFYNVFGNGDELVVERSTLPEASENTFDEDAYKDVLLKTTDTEVANKEPWKNFANVEGSSSEQCAAPTIEYAGGKLKFTFDPSSFEPGKINEGKIKDGVTIISKITIDDTSENSTNEVELSKNYIVTAYAKKDGCRRSATVTKTFKFMNGDVNLNGEINIVDAQLIVNKIVGKIDALSREFNIDLDSEENTLDPQ